MHFTEEKGLTQEKLARLIYKRRTSLSEIENGKMYPDIVSLLLISFLLHKPMTYFIPKYARAFPDNSELTEQEEAPLFHFRRITDQEKNRLAIIQVQSIADIDTVPMKQFPELA